MPEYVFIIGIVSISSALLAALLAALKQRSVDKWAFAGAVFPPVVLVLLLLPKCKTPPKRKISESDLDELKERLWD